VADEPGSYGGVTFLHRTPGQKAYFFLEGVLYKNIRQDRAANVLYAQNMETKKIETFLLSDAKRKMKNAYDTVEVAKLLNRNRGTVQQYVSRGIINSPVRIQSKGMNSKGHPFTKMKWSEDDIIALHDYLLTAGGGRPRKDGILYPATRLPSRRELLAMMRQQPMFYMKTATGEFVPVWSAHNEV
jgi:hypothetical protein